jgi:hypothetical protein
MPNWCVNRLIVEGPEEVMQKFMEKSFEDDEGGRHFVFSGTVDARNPPEGGWPHSESVDPCLKNYYCPEEIVWGVRCNPASANEDDPILECTPTRLHLEFLTRWSPPITWVENVVSQEAYAALELQLAYCEAGMGFYGSIIIDGTGIKEFVQGRIENGLIYPQEESEETSTGEESEETPLEETSEGEKLEETSPGEETEEKETKEPSEPRPQKTPEEELSETPSGETSEGEKSEEESGDFTYGVRVNWKTPFGYFVKRWGFEDFGG